MKSPISRDVLKGLSLFLISPLVDKSSDGFTASLGRILLIATFILAVFKWSHGIDVTSSHLTVLLSLLAYNLGTKFTDSAKDILGAFFSRAKQ